VQKLSIGAAFFVSERRSFYRNISNNTRDEHTVNHRIPGNATFPPGFLEIGPTPTL